MKKDVTTVPKDKCPLDVLAELGERTRNAWIFLDANAIEKIASIAVDCCTRPFVGFQEYSYFPDFPETSIQIEMNPSEDSDKVWWEVYCIESSDIAFHFPADDPAEIFFLKMEE